MRWLLMSTALVVALGAADLSGVWTLELDPDFSGNPDSVACSFRQDGSKLAIQCGGASNRGEVHDRRVTFQIKTGLKNELTATFTADLDEKGTAMKGTWRLQDQTGNFSATKQ
jgi:hypothetical protein